MTTVWGLVFFVLANGVAAQQCSDDQRTADNNDASCRRYYECSRGQYYTSQCPDGQVFYPGFNGCVLQNSYDCVCNSPCVRPDCTGRNNQDIPDKTNCSRFVYCNGNYPLRRDCPAGNIFNPDKVTCEPSATSKYVCPNGPFQCPYASGTFEDKRDPYCQTYQQCNNWVATKYVCDNGWHYYGKLNKCVLPDSYDCHDPNPFVCPQPDRDYADPRDAHRYYYCMGDAPLHRTCPQGQNFNGADDVRRCV